MACCDTGLMAQGAKCGVGVGTRSRGSEVFLAQATEVHRMDNCVILARAAGVLSRSSG